MALSASTVWEVRSDGSDANSGGFVTGASGTDFSQQAAAQIAYTDMVIDAVTNTKFTSAANPVTDAHVGNLVNVTGGVGFTVQRVYIVSQAAGVATCDKSLGTLGSTGGTGNLGGAFLTWNACAAVMVAENIMYIKGTYTISALLTAPPAGTDTRRPTQVIGYGTTRGDGIQATIQHDGVSAAFFMLSGNNYCWFMNLNLDGVDIATRGLTMGTPALAWNIKVQRMVDFGLLMASVVAVAMWCEVTDMKAGASAAFYCDTRSTFEFCWAHDNPVQGFLLSNGIARHCIASNNTGAASDGYQVSGTAQEGIFEHCIAYGNGRDGIRFTGDCNSRPPINCILVNNGGYGVNMATGVAVNNPGYRNNAYYNNTSGARNNLAAEPGAVTLAGDPFTNAAGNDFSLNNIAGAGAACRNAGFPGALPGLATPLGYADIGVYRHQDPATGGLRTRPRHNLVTDGVLT